MLKRLKRKIKNKKKVHQEKLYGYIKSCWNTEGASDKLLGILEYAYFVEESLDSRGHLIYICVLLELGKCQDAKIALKDHIEKYGLEFIDEYLPVAFLAHQMKITGGNIAKSAEIFQAFNDVSIKAEFEEYVRKGTIAIIGNSPNILGTNVGYRIDQSDIVCRMNVFRIESQKDMGIRTDIYVNNSNAVTLSDVSSQRYTEYKWIFVAADIYHQSIEEICPGNKEKFIDYYCDLLQQGKKIFILPQSWRTELCKFSGIKYPSAGLLTIWCVYKIKGHLSKEWIFGFNDKIHEEKAQEVWEDHVTTTFQDAICGYTYWKGKEWHHNFDEELRFRKKLEGAGIRSNNELEI